MKIRSITYFLDPGWPLNENKFQAAGRFLDEAKSAFEAEGYQVQTTRLATIPFPTLLKGEINQAISLAQDIEHIATELGIAYTALGPALPEFPASYDIIPEAIAATENVFFSGVMADRNNIHPATLRACAKVIVRCAPLDPNGFGNLYFAALANVPPGAPFFPAAYHQGDRPAFAIATEAADLAVEAFNRPWTVDEGRIRLVSSIEKHGQALVRIATDLQSASPSTTFGGIDFSLAPFPTDEQSLGGAVERIGIPKIGMHGSLASAALLTEAVDRADFQHTGFSGFMQPVLEDSVLAKRAAEGTLTIKDLLLYSTVCGTGLDTVPLPGDVSADQIAALLLDLSALALRLDKPLTARLMPIPGKKAGDPTGFDFEFFANSKVMALEAEKLGGVLSGDEILELQPHRP
ncbi:MAG: DUF711 family protein [Anaerolineales bacterium]|jgi:uncharacterized protein (UPF0210 family)